MKILLEKDDVCVLDGTSSQHLFSQAELNDLVRDLELAKEKVVSWFQISRMEFSPAKHKSFPFPSSPFAVFILLTEGKRLFLSLHQWFDGKDWLSL